MADLTAMQGIVPAIVTPFHEDGSVNDNALRQLVRFELEAGVGGIIPTGSTGEFFSLTHEERKHVVEIVTAEVDGAVPVVPLTSALTTAEAVVLSKHAEDNGASGVLVIPPYYEPNAWHEVLSHFEAISNAVNVPIVYYHMPAATGLELTLEQFEELAQIPNVKYTKDSSGNAVQMFEVTEALRGSLTVCNGEDKLVFSALAAGAKTAIWGSSTFYPGLAVELYETLAVKQDLSAAREVWQRIWPILTTIGETSWQSAVKAGAELVGIPAGVPRLPIKPASKEFYSKLRSVLVDSGVRVVD